MKYTFVFQFDSGAEKSISLESDLTLEQINNVLYMFFQGRSPIPNVAINPNKLLAIQIEQQSVPQEVKTIEEDQVG